MGLSSSINSVAALCISISLFFHIILMSSTCDGQKVVCKAKEREALLRFKNGLSSDSQEMVLSSWVENEDCCNWKGVGCNNLTGHVVKLNVDSVHGEIGPSLVDLVHLQHLNLSWNDFGKRSIPECFGSFKELRYLDLSFSNLSGTIPPQLGNISTLESLELYMNNGLESDGTWISRLSSLQYLDMNSVTLSKATSLFQELNKLPFISLIVLSACNPDPLSLEISLDYVNFTHLSYLDISENMMDFQIPQWLVNATNLEYLDLSWNNIISGGDVISRNLCNLGRLHLDGTSVRMDIGDFFRACNRRLYLEELHLLGNQITGQLPSWLGDYKRLVIIGLSSNLISGTIPKSIGAMASLKVLDLGYNSLHGIVSDASLNLSHLEFLDISRNSLEIMLSSDWVPPFSLSSLEMSSCKVGPNFPLWLQTQTKLEELFMSNSSISDVLPQWIWNFAPNLVDLDLSMNNIKGLIPVAFNKSSMQTVDLHSNKLEGSLASLPSSITYLMLSNNKLSGPIILRNRSIVLSISKNNLSGKITSSLCNATMLNVLDVSDNRLSGHLPSCLGNPNLLYQSCSIQSLHLSNNNLEGILPAWLKNCIYMNVIDMGENRFIGNIPSWIPERMHKLQVLRLRSNSFDGVIPQQLPSLKLLQILDLAENNLSGSIPHTFGDFVAMKIKNFQNERIGDQTYYTESITVTFKDQVMFYDRILNFLSSMDLSRNRLSGEIPQELGNLYGLVNLNLSHNYLTGNIPACFGNLRQLESLDLSRNNISGVIPQSLSALTYLSKFNVSFNNLSGKIPIGNQFDSFSNSSYLDNAMLCGKPLDLCNAEQEPPTFTRDGQNESNNEYLWLYIGFMLGFVMGLCAFWGTFIIKRNWGYVYFQFIDNLCGKCISLSIK